MSASIAGRSIEVDPVLPLFRPAGTSFSIVIHYILFKQKRIDICLAMERARLILVV